MHTHTHTQTHPHLPPDLLAAPLPPSMGCDIAAATKEGVEVGRDGGARTGGPHPCTGKPVTYGEEGKSWSQEARGALCSEVSWLVACRRRWLVTQCLQWEGPPCSPLPLSSPVCSRFQELAQDSQKVVSKTDSEEFLVALKQLLRHAPLRAEGPSLDPAGLPDSGFQTKLFSARWWC